MGPLLLRSSSRLSSPHSGCTLESTGKLVKHSRAQTPSRTSWARIPGAQPGGERPFLQLVSLRAMRVDVAGLLSSFFFFSDGTLSANESSLGPLIYKITRSRESVRAASLVIESGMAGWGVGAEQLGLPHLQRTRWAGPCQS